jgi:hypothetical protein
MEALQDALKIFGNDASEALMFHLKKRLPGLGQDDITVEDVESALYDILGPGAQLLVNTVRQVLHLPTNGTETR